MAKGRTTQPLVIWVAPEWIEHLALVTLASSGHTVRVLPPLYANVAEPDLILHPAAWRWGEWAWPYLNQAIMEARRAKRAREAGA